MKKYIIAIVAVLIVAAIGIYFGNPDLFQGRIFPSKTTTEKYIVKKGFCIRPSVGIKGEEPKDLTGTETKTEDNSRGIPTAEVKKEETPTVDPSKITTIGGSGNTVTYDTPPSGEKDDGKSKDGKPGIEVTVQDCGCKDSGKIKSEIKDSKGNIVSQVICAYKAPDQCLRETSEYKCPSGTDPDWGKIYDFCKTVKSKQCFASKPPSSDDVSFCKVYNGFTMDLACTPSKECADIYASWWAGEGTPEIMKKLNIPAEEAQNLISKCISGVVSPSGSN